jgi:NAD dependent epimerase/dehydratase family enzyme
VNQHYEQKAKLLSKLGIRTVQLRLGHVLGDKGFVADVHRMDEKGRAFWTKIGSGDQWLPWIHVSDAIDMITHAIDNESVRGVVNGVAPQQVKQIEFAEHLRSVLPSKTWKFPMPETVANWTYPKRAHILTEGRYVIPRVALETDFRFNHPNLDSAMETLKPHLIPIRWKNPVNKYFDPNKPLHQAPD